MSLVSDAGTPLLSDPGRLLVNKCIENGIQIIPVPGVSSITTALSVSGFKDQFIFYGFLPKTKNETEKVLNDLSDNKFTLVFFIPSNKINFYIANFKKYFSGRENMIAKEITKIHEAFFRDEIDKLKIFKISLKESLQLLYQKKVQKL